MIKKIFFGTALTAVATAVFAFGVPAPYVGGGAGLNINTSKGNLINSYRGIPVRVLAGYGGIVNQNFYLGGEAVATLFTADLDSSAGKSTWGYGASFIPGIMLSDNTLLYARLGFVRSDYVKRSFTTGSVLGVGLQATVTQNIDLRGEYAYTSYTAFDYGSQRIGSPRSDNFNFDIIYKFD